MPTECERSLTSPSGTAGSTQATTAGGVASAALIAAEIQSSSFHEELSQQQQMMEGDMSTSQTSTTSNGSSCNGGIRKTSITSPDPTAYVAKARVTRPTPPPPPYNPMQFVQIKPCNLYQTAQEQLKKAEEVKKIKEIRKEEPEDWQNNLDNWKSSRRKRVEHIIDRVVEVKKLELEEHDRTRRKSKTFSELIENRGERVGRPGLNKLASLAVYNEDETNDLSDLGIGTSSASGKSSLSEDYDNNSVMSDNAAELDKAISNSNHKLLTDSTTREYISSPGYETSSSTAPASSPDPCEYTYEGAIQDYKQRVSRAAASGLTSQALNKLTTQQQHNSKESTPERAVKETSYPPRRGSKIEDRLIGFEVQSPSEECVTEKNKVHVPKIDISKRKEIFESQTTETKATTTNAVNNIGSGAGVPRLTLRDRFKPQESTEPVVEVAAKKDVKRLSGDITSIKERLQNLEQQQNLVNGANGASKTTANKLVDIPVPPLKERLSSLQNAVTKEEVRKPPVALVDARQLEIMKSEEEKAKQTIKEEVAIIATKTNINTNTTTTTTITSNQVTLEHPSKTEESEVDRDDSGIHTADDIDIVEDRLNTEHIKKEQELKLNAAIEALAMEEKQFAEAASAVNQIEAEFDELSLGSVALPPLASSTNSNGTSTNTGTSASTTTITNDHMEYSVSSTNQHTICLSSSSSSPISSDSCNASSLLPNVEVKVDGSSQPPVAGSSLRRKPTNEMVHAKNLLKIFKETFQNDIELDEDDDDHRNQQETKQIPNNQNPKDKPISVGIKTRIFENSLVKAGNDQSLPCASRSSPISGHKVLPNVSSPPCVTLCSPVSTTMIPRCVTPSIKSPLSPLTVRSTTKFRDETPPGSPFASRKHDSQFSINGRVEIFNSKNMATPASNLPRAQTPTMTAKKTLLPHITTTNATPSSPTSSAATPKSSASNDIRLPEQPKQQHQPAVTALQSQKAATATSTVIEPLSTQETKSMPSRQMVNEPQTPIATASATATTATVVATIDARETPTQNHSNCNAVKQQQQPPHQPEVVICAPPITIVNPDELPKPNTVKNLSSCFQQQHHDAPAPVPSAGSKLISPKPMPRSRIPQATPPHSPIAVKRNVVASTPEKTLVIWPPPSTTSTTPPLDEEKKLSLISSSSTSSTSSVCTVIEANKKLSIMSNSSTVSTDSSIVPPTIVTTNAQVHKNPEGKVQVAVDATKETLREHGNKTAEISQQPSIESKSSESKPCEAKTSEFNSYEPKPSESKLSEASDPKSTEPKTSAPKSCETEQIADLDLKELLNNFIKIETEFSQTCEIRPKKLANSHEPKKTSQEVKSVSESQPKQLQGVQRKPSLKIARKDSEKPLKTVAFSEEIYSEAKSVEQKTSGPEASQEEPLETTLLADVDVKALKNDFIRLETEVSQACEIKPISLTKPFTAPLQPIKVVIRDNDGVKGNIQTPSTPQAARVAEAPLSPESTKTSANESGDNILATSEQQTPPSANISTGSVAKAPSRLPQTKKLPLTIDVSQGNKSGPISPETRQTLPSTPLSPSSQLFRTTKPLVVSTLYDKYVSEDPKSRYTVNAVIVTPKVDLQPPNNQRPLLPSPKQEEQHTTPTIVTPAEVPNLVDCPPNDSTLYKLASSAPHSPVSTGSNVDNPIDFDSALCSSLLTSMAATPDMVNFQRQQTVEEIPCQKVDVRDMPVEKVVSSTGYVDISKEDVKQSQGFVSKIIHRMQSPIMKRQKTAEEELCQKVDIRDIPDGKYQPVTDYKSVSPSEIQKCDKFFSTGLGKPQSPITEARAAHSKALIETCEKIIAEEKQTNNQMKSSLPAEEPRGTPILQKKSKIPKPLPSCCKGAESMTEADLLQARTTNPKSPSPPSSPPGKDDAVIARMHVVETQIKVTTTTPPASPKDEKKPQASPQPPKKSKNIFDFIKKNFGVGGGGGGGSHKEGDDQVDSKSKADAQQPLVPPPPPPSIVKSDNKVLVLTPQDVQNFDHVTYDEIHNVDNSKFYLPADDVAPPPLPKTPAPVNIEITRKIITDEIVEDGKTEMELTDEIDALLDVELNKLNHEIDELDKAGKK